MSGRARGERLEDLPGKAKKAPARKKPSCPICGKPVTPEYRPFCSRRCADIELGRWLGGRYAVPGESIGAEPEPVEPEDDEGANR